MKKYIRRAVSSIVALSILLVVWHIITTGRIIITAPSKDGIISVVDKRGALVVSGVGKLSAPIAMGDYTVTVNSKVFSTSKLVHIRWHQTYRETFKSAKLHDLEPVVGQDAYSVVASSNTLRYLAGKESYIMRIDGTNTISALTTGNKITNVQWADPSYGIAIDTKGELFEVSENTIQALRFPVKITQDSYATVAVNQDRSMYVSVRGVVYYGTQEAGFKKIYTSKSETPQIVSSPERALIINTVTSGTVAPQITTTVTLISKSGDAQGSITIPQAENMPSGPLFVWSPDGKRLALFGGDANNAIYDENLHKLLTIPGVGLANPHWTNNTTLFYSQQNTLWQYDTSTQNASAYAALGADTEINSITSDEQENYVYINGVIGSTHALLRVGLKDQPVSPNAYDLSIYLPIITEEGCTINYINFTNIPKIVISAISADDFNMCNNISSAMITSTSTPYKDTPKQYIVSADQTTYY